MKTIVISSVALALSLGISAAAQTHHAMGSATTSLSSLLAEGESQNAQVSSAGHAWQASTHCAQEATTLPDPQLTVQNLSVGSPKPWAGFSNSDFAYVGFGASQDLPFPGKLRARGAAAEREAEAQKAQIDVVRTNIKDQVKAAYLRLAYLHQTIDLLDRNSNVLDTLIQTEVSRYSVGQGSQADILRAQ